MQKIIIKNFRAIEYAEIELKKVLVLIGAQASGKSTIAKLIYFFKTIQDDFFVQVYESGNTDLEKLVRRKFIEFFGLVKMDFEVEFWFDENMFIKLKNYQSEISVRLNLLNDNNFENLDNYLEDIKEKQVQINSTWLGGEIYERQKETLIKDLSKYINQLFGYKQNDNLYVIAGRNVTVNYSNIFSQYFNNKVQEELQGVKNFDATDEQLMLKFIKRVDKIKARFELGGSFEGVVDSFANELGKYFKDWGKTERKISKQAAKILKGKYQIVNNNEQLVLENGKSKSINLSDASSGQQEVIRILQDLLWVTLFRSKFLRIIEEPEAHLFPIAQKELIELLALAVNYQPENQLIIATHSPYILSVFNNLLFANEVATKDESLQGEVSEIIDKDFWLKAEDFAAYTLGGEEAYCESIMSEDGGMIDQNYLDEVSEMLGMEFYALREIYRKTFKSKRR